MDVCFLVPTPPLFITLNCGSLPQLPSLSNLQRFLNPKTNNKEAASNLILRQPHPFFSGDLMTSHIYPQKCCIKTVIQVQGNKILNY